MVFQILKKKTLQKLNLRTLGTVRVHTKDAVLISNVWVFSLLFSFKAPGVRYTLVKIVFSAFFVCLVPQKTCVLYSISKAPHRGYRFSAQLLFVRIFQFSLALFRLCFNFLLTRQVIGFRH